MIFNFDASGLNQPINCGSVDGFIICWGFHPFWVGDNAPGLIQTGADVGTLQKRDGMYINAQMDGNGIGPIVLPWTGQVWILNANGSKDNPINTVMMKLVNRCSDMVSNPTISGGIIG